MKGFAKSDLIILVAIIISLTFALPKETQKPSLINRFTQNYNELIDMIEN